MHHLTLLFTCFDTSENKQIKKPKKKQKNTNEEERSMHAHQHNGKSSKEIKFLLNMSYP